jgi:putative sigma-54 modulation protein
MNVHITGRHMEVTDGLRGHIENGVSKLASHFDRVIDVNVVLDVEKHRHIAEVSLLANGLRIHSKESSLDMYASVDAVLHKLERQCLKYKNRINRHTPRTADVAFNYDHAILAPATTADETAKAEASEAARGHHEVKRETHPTRALTVDEAVLQLELTEDAVLVFSNSETKQINVMYKRNDGTFGLIEPQAAA